MKARTHTSTTHTVTHIPVPPATNAVGALGRVRRLRRELRENERGAAMVEFAISSVFLVILLFGIIEGGLAFRAKLSISNSADEAARRGAIAGSDPYADYEILQQVVAHSSATNAITSVIVFRATAGLDEPPLACRAATSAADQCNRYTPADLLRPKSDFGNCTLESGWCPSTRSSALKTGDYIGIWISGRFDSPTGALGHLDLVDSSVLPMESKGG